MHTFSLDGRTHDVCLLWDLTLFMPTVYYPVSELEWNADESCWSESSERISPRAVLREPEKHPEHATRMRNADLSCRLLLMESNGRVVVVDGMHRLCGALRRNVKVLPACVVTAEALQCALIDQ